MQKITEQWLVKIGKKEFVISGNEKKMLVEVMKSGERWFETQNGDILSVSHIESVTLHSRTKEDLKLPEPKFVPLPEEKMANIRKKVYSNIKKIV